MNKKQPISINVEVSPVVVAELEKVIEQNKSLDINSAVEASVSSWLIQHGVEGKELEQSASRPLFG